MRFHRYAVGAIFIFLLLAAASIGRAGYFDEPPPPLPAPTPAEDKIVLAGFTGSFKWMNNPTTFANVRSTFYADGKVNTMTLYPDSQATLPSAETKFTYFPNGEIYHIETSQDSNGDGYYDLKNELTNTWDDTHQRMSYSTWKSSPISGTAVVLASTPGLNMFGKKYVYPDEFPKVQSGQIYLATTHWDLTRSYPKYPNNPGVNTAVNNELQTLIPGGIVGGKLADSQIYSWVPEDSNNYDSGWFPFTAENKEYDYVGEKPLEIRHFFYFCPKQTGQVCSPYHPINAPMSGPIVGLSPGLVPYYKIVTHWTYGGPGGSGPPSKIELKIYGNPDANHPEAHVDENKFVIVTCNIDYYPDAGKVIAAFPQEMKDLGLSENDKIKSMVCNDNGAGMVNVNLQFNDWRNLQDVVGFGAPAAP
jgi:hypothetical protein